MTRRPSPDPTLQLRLPEAPAETASYAVFDLETTGFDPRSCAIIEIGWCVVRGVVPEPERSLLVRCNTVPAAIQTLTGIDAELLRTDGVSLEDALGTFLSETRDLPLVGHNVLHFDLGFVEAACRRTGLEAPHRSRYRDTAGLYKAHRLGMRPLPGQDHWSFATQALDRRAPGLRYSLSVCCRELDIPNDGVRAHRAAGDVVITQRLYARLLELALW